MTHPLKIAKLSNAERVEFGPLSFYHPLVADGDTPVRTGIQTANPGYQATMHWHPYTELLFIIEGEADVWLDGEAPLHFKQCQVFGEHPDPAIRARMREEETLAEQRRGYIRDGRRGRVLEIGGLATFVDDEHSDERINSS